MTELNPETFDLNAWLDGAERTIRATTVYQRADLVGELDLLATRIENAEREEAVDGPSMGGGSVKLRAEYAKVADQFKASGLVVKMKALTTDEKLAIEKAHKKDTGAHVLAASMIEPTMSAAQILRFEKAIGNAQMAFVIRAFNRACEDAPSVSADFLPKSSGQESSDE